MPTTKTAKRIERVQLVRELDDSPDTSYLGEYSSSPGPNDRTIDREERGDRGRNEFRYFIAANSADDTGNPESVEQDYKRMEALNAGDWSYIGIYATAEIVVNGTCQRVRSPGLWGIESDSEQSHFDEIGKEELAQLRDVLSELGFSARVIDSDFKEVDWKDD